MQVLLTAFKNTSSETLIKSINDYDRLIFENDKIKSVKQLEQALKNNYRYIISFGQRPIIKDKIHMECQAMIGDKIIETAFDIAKLRKLFVDFGISVKLSYNAGTSYCNNIYYQGMKMITENGLYTEMVFIHIPYIKNISNYTDFLKTVEKGINKFLSEEQ